MAQLDLIGIVAGDMATSLNFYRLLGLDIPLGVENEPHVEFITPGGLRLAWDTLALMQSIDPGWVTPVGQRMSLAFKCGSPAEVDTLYAQAVNHGYAGHKAPWDAFWGQRYAVVVDPDDNHVDLFAAL